MCSSFCLQIYNIRSKQCFLKLFGFALFFIILLGEVIAHIYKNNWVLLPQAALHFTPLSPDTDLATCFLPICITISEVYLCVLCMHFIVLTNAASCVYHLSIIHNSSSTLKTPPCSPPLVIPSHLPQVLAIADVFSILVRKAHKCSLFMFDECECNNTTCKIWGLFFSLREMHFSFIYAFA